MMMVICDVTTTMMVVVTIVIMMMIAIVTFWINYFHNAQGDVSIKFDSNVRKGTMNVVVASW